MSNLAGAERENTLCFQRIAVGNAFDLVLGLSTLTYDRGETVVGSGLFVPGRCRIVPDAGFGELWSTAPRDRGRDANMSDLRGYKLIGRRLVVEE
jgi:hypothetical protein